MRKSSSISVICVFLAFISLFFVLNLVLPDKEFSPRENRYLQQAPVFSFKALADGSFTEDFECYITDQFTFRDAWTTLKARCERLTGKQENKGVYYADGGYLLEEFIAPSHEKIAANVGYINTLAENVDIPVSFALIPGASEIYRDLLPAYAPSDSQKDVIDQAYALFGGETIDMFVPLEEHIDDYIFYRTDHHWTSLGAYYGFTAISEAWGLPYSSVAEYERETVSEAFYGTTYSSSGFSWVEPDRMETFVPDDGSIEVKSYTNGTPEVVPMYDKSFLNEKDKYSMFFGGNTPRLEIDTGHEGERLLILRDSYCDSLAPFLMENFSHITMLDMRYFKSSVAEFAAENGFDRILVIYSVENFCEDQNIFMMSF